MPLPKHLSGPQTLKLREILKKMFKLDELDDFLTAEFDIAYDDFATGARNQIYRDVVEYFNRRSTIPTLLNKLRVARQDDDDLLLLMQEIGGLALRPVDAPNVTAIERTIREANSMLDPRAWIKRLATIETQICRVEVPVDRDWVFGTGFLVAPDVVITNYHVVEDVVDGLVVPTSIGLRFDYAILEDGVTPNPGTIYRLAADWLIDYSKYSSLDMQDNPADDPESNELDYALLRVAGAPGSSAAGGGVSKTANPQPRGWIAIPSKTHDFQKESALYIMQHPEGKELKLALDTHAIIGVNGNGTRVRYKTNTEGGSSGSPCFDANWNLVALHHAGDPNFSELHKPQYNQGIPFTKIVDLLKQRGKDSALDG